MPYPLKGKRVVVTGGAGFLASHLLPQLRLAGAEVVPVDIADYDLTRAEETAWMYGETRPQALVHLAGVVGGIGANRENPGLFFYANMAMGINVIEGARAYGLEKLLVAGTTCGYPKFTPIPFKEEDFFNGYPEETNAPYGIAKRALLVMAQSYRAQYGLNAVYVIPANLYGPRENFDEASSHVIPALIRRFVEARESGAGSVTVWGTGTASREFLYAEDCARGMALALEYYDGAEPVNLGTGEEITIRDLVELIRKEVGYPGRIEWDASQPDGQPRRRLDTSRARERFGFEAQVGLAEGIHRTVAWFEEHRQEARGIKD